MVRCFMEIIRIVLVSSIVVAVGLNSYRVYKHRYGVLGTSGPGNTFYSRYGFCGFGCAAIAISTSLSRLRVSNCWSYGFRRSL